MNFDHARISRILMELINSKTPDETRQIVDANVDTLLDPYTIAFLRERVVIAQDLGRTHEAELMRIYYLLLLDSGDPQIGLDIAWAEFIKGPNAVLDEYKAHQVRIGLFKISSEEELLFYLQEHKQILLTTITIQKVQNLVDEAENSPNLVEVSKWKRMLQLLKDSQSMGIQDARDKYCAQILQEDEQQNVYRRAQQEDWILSATRMFRNDGDPTFFSFDNPQLMPFLDTVSGGIPENPQLLLQRAKQLSRPTDLPYKIRLLTIALNNVDTLSDPLLWAEIHHMRGLARIFVPTGDRVQNIENAITDFSDALSVDLPPYSHGVVSDGMGVAYALRISGNPEESYAKSNACFEEALTYLTREEYPFEWIKLHIEKATNHVNPSGYGDIEQAIAELSDVLTTLSPHPYAFSWAHAAILRSSAYLIRIDGNKEDNYRQALRDINEGISIATFERAPFLWASAMQNQGVALSFLGDLAGAVEAFTLAMTYFTREIYPLRHITYRYQRAQIYAIVEKWDQAHADLTVARDLLDWSLDEAQSTITRIEAVAMYAPHEIYLTDAEVILRLLPDKPSLWPELVSILEEGRARSIRIAFDLDNIELHQMDPIPEALSCAQEVIAARDIWRIAQQECITPPPLGQNPKVFLEQNAQKLQEAYQTLNRARDTYRRFSPGFMVTKAPIHEIIETISAPEEALVYVAAGKESGLAIIVMRNRDGTPLIRSIALPNLTASNIQQMYETRAHHFIKKTPNILHKQDNVCGGYGICQTKSAFEALMYWGKTTDDALERLPSASSFAIALRQIKQIWQTDSTRSQYLDAWQTPFEQLSITDKGLFEADFFKSLLYIELDQSLNALQVCGFNLLAEDLLRNHVHRVVLIPYGLLGTFPLQAIPITLPGQNRRTLSDLFTMVIAPSAILLGKVRQQVDRIMESHNKIVTAGKPDPTPEGFGDLEWAEAEADTIASIAKRRGYARQHIHSKEMQKQRMIEAWSQGWFVHLATHAEYFLDSPLQSCIILAGKGSIKEEWSLSLEECLTRSIRGLAQTDNTRKFELTGVQLLILSACQTSVIDTHRAVNETIGIATGFLQAGVAGVIATLWPVDDRAAYLLMSRFAECYFDPQLHWNAAQALAEAQRWLREDVTNMYLSTYIGFSSFRGLRFPQTQAFRELRSLGLDGPPDMRPYAHPFYWAAFILSGANPIASSP